MQDYQNTAAFIDVSWDKDVYVGHPEQVLSSSWDGRPFGHNRHAEKWAAAPHFSFHVYCLCLCRFFDHSRIQVDENQLMSCWNNNFMRVVHICLILIK